MQKKALRFTDNWVYTLLVVLSFVLYGNTIFNNYGFDDAFVVTGNQYVQKGTDGIQEILDLPYAKLGNYVLDRRPIPLVTFALEHEFLGDNPHWSHFINVLLFALTLMVLYSVLIHIFHLGKEYSFLPFIIVLFYAVHPIHTEVVDSLKNRDELLVMLFGLLFLKYGYYYYTQPKYKYWYAAISLFCLALTLLSKITGFIFVGILVLVCYFEQIFKGKKWNYIFIFLCLWMVVSAMIRVFENLNRSTYLFENPLTVNKSIWVSLGTASSILLYHIKMLLYPSPLLFYYGGNMFPLVTLLNPLAFISFVFHLFLLGYGVMLFYKKDNLGLFILCYFVAIALYSNFPVPYTSMFAERALFMSSLWFIVILALLVVRLWSKYAFLQTSVYKNAALTILSVLFVVYSFMTIQRNFLWKNALTLMSHDIKYLDKSILANYIYANNLKYESKITEDKALAKTLAEKAVYHYEQSIALAPNYPEFYFKLGSTYRYNLKNLDSAEVNFGYAISIDSLYGDANYELAKLYFDKQDYRKSYYFFNKTYAIQPKDTLTLFYYAQSAANVGDMSVCFNINQEFLKLYPALQYPYLNLGIYYSTIRKDDSAVIYLDKAVELGARNKQLLKQLSIYYGNKNNITKRDYYNKMLSE